MISLGKMVFVMGEYSVALMDFAKKLVLDCGEKLREKRRKSNFLVREKDGYSDIVTDHDIWVQQYLSERIMKQYPGHSILGEEGMGRRGDAPWKWVIDPIDGTTNYCKFGKEYAISLAILYQGKPIYGFVLDVENRRFYEGHIDNWKQTADQKESPEESILHIGFKTMQEFSRQGADPYALAERFCGVRYYGCASLELCSITEEQSSFYVNTNLKLWDFAAAYVVLLSRGCKLVAVEVSKGAYFVCAYRFLSLYQQCYPYFPESVRQLLNKNGGKFFHVTD